MDFVWEMLRPRRSSEAENEILCMRDGKQRRAGEGRHSFWQLEKWGSGSKRGHIKIGSNIVDDLKIVRNTGKDHTPDYSSGSHLKWLRSNDHSHSAFTVPRTMSLLETYPMIETCNGSPASKHSVTNIQYVGYGS
jgi:hypothetical protein